MPAKSPMIRFSHVGIYVTDLPRMEAFYVGVLGLTVTDRGRLDGTDIVFTSTDPTEHHQLVLAAGRPDGNSFNTVNQISFRVDGLATLRAMYRRLQKESVRELAPVTHGNALSVYFLDPEGNRVELFIDTPWYVPQPLRVPMDMTLSEEAVWNWAERAAREMPGFRSREQWESELRTKMGLDGWGGK